MTAPIYQMLKNYRKSDPLPFHMPGHRLGEGLAGEMKAAGALDITEIPGADCLHSPDGVIREAQDLAARCFGADYTVFLVNGSTSGIHAMIQSVVPPGGKLIVGRDCHVSVCHALAIIDAEPVYVSPVMDDTEQISLGIAPEDMEKALLENPDAKGILITRPSYYGVAQPLKGLVGLSRRFGIPLLVDEAHGAHFAFHPDFPATAMEEGADLCVQSLHKTLPAMTQTALLHGKMGGLVDRSTVEMMASMVQTTSPSYVLMASMDLARERMENEGYELYEGLRLRIKEFDERLSKTSIERTARNYSGFETDFSRIVLSFAKTSLSGFKAEKLLRESYSIVAEMADLRHIVLIATPFHTPKDFERLSAVLEVLSREYGGVDLKRRITPAWPDKIPERVCSLREALFSAKREVPVGESAGKVSAVSVVPYPPGIPLIHPGERITQDILDTVRILLESNCPVHGIRRGTIQIMDPCQNR